MKAQRIRKGDIVSISGVTGIVNRVSGGILYIIANERFEWAVKSSLVIKVGRQKNA